MKGSRARADAQETTLLWNAPPPIVINESQDVYHAVRQVLAESGHQHRLRLQVGRQRFRKMSIQGRCSECARKSTCTWRLCLASYDVETDRLHLSYCGSHGESTRVAQGGRVLTAAGEDVAARCGRTGERLSVRTLRTALTVARAKQYASPKQLRTFVRNFNYRATAGPPRSSQRTRIAHLVGEVARWRAGQAKTLSESSPESLYIFDEVVIDDVRVFIPFATRGMIDRMKSFHGHQICLVVDAKEKIVAQQYRICTLGALVRSDIPRSTTIARVGIKGGGGAREVKARQYTGHLEPFIQCVFHSESKDNWKQLFLLAIRLAHEHCS